MDRSRPILLSIRFVWFKAGGLIFWTTLLGLVIFRSRLVGAHDGQLDPLQKAFIQYGGFQCGICTPGQIMSAKALLDVNPYPTRDEIKAWMMGNLCRCTGYYKIIESIQAAAEGKVS